MDGSLPYILPRLVIHAACAPITPGKKEVLQPNCESQLWTWWCSKIPDKVDFGGCGGCSAWMQCWIWMQRRNWHCVELILTRSIIGRAAFNILHQKMVVTLFRNYQCLSSVSVCAILFSVAARSPVHFRQVILSILTQESLQTYGGNCQEKTGNCKMKIMLISFDK